MLCNDNKSFNKYIIYFSKMLYYNLEEKGGEQGGEKLIKNISKNIFCTTIM